MSNSKGFYFNFLNILILLIVSIVTIISGACILTAKRRWRSTSNDSTENDLLTAIGNSNLNSNVKKQTDSKTSERSKTAMSATWTVGIGVMILIISILWAIFYIRNGPEKYTFREGFTTRKSGTYATLALLIILLIMIILNFISGTNILHNWSCDLTSMSMGGVNSDTSLIINSNPSLIRTSSTGYTVSPSQAESPAPIMFGKPFKRADGKHFGLKTSFWICSFLAIGVILGYVVLFMFITIKKPSKKSRAVTVEENMALEKLAQAEAQVRATQLQQNKVALELLEARKAAKMSQAENLRKANAKLGADSLQRNRNETKIKQLEGEIENLQQKITKSNLIGRSEIEIASRSNPMIQNKGDEEEESSDDDFEGMLASPQQPQDNGEDSSGSGSGSSNSESDDGNDSE